jgi:hypothetical protein
MRLINLAAMLAILALGSGCATIRRDRCYLAETRYMAIRAIFEQTGSFQRAAQAMNDEGWAHCEINQFRYRLRKDLGLDEPEFQELFLGAEPNRKYLDFNPGRVEEPAP